MGGLTRRLDLRAMRVCVNPPSAVGSDSRNSQTRAHRETLCRSDAQLRAGGGVPGPGSVE